MEVQQGAQVELWSLQKLDFPNVNLSGRVSNFALKF